jgi:hypothetical protein
MGQMWATDKLDRPPTPDASRLQLYTERSKNSVLMEETERLKSLSDSQSS